MYRKLSLLLLIALIPTQVAAAPLSEPTAANKTAIAEHFDAVADKQSEHLKVFSDVPFTHPDYLSIAYFKKQGLVQGVSGKFYPDSAMTRGGFAKLFAEVKSTTTLGPATERPFFDVPTNMSYSRGVKFMKENGLIKGYPDGTFHPDDAITLYAVKSILGMPLAKSPDTSRVATRAETLRLIYDAFPTDRLYEKQSFDNVKLSVTEKEILANGKAVRGLFVNFLSHVDQFSDDVLRDNFVKIRQAGFIGVSIEIPWVAIEPQDTKIGFPAYYDRFITIAKEEGLWTTVLLSPHYTPDWVFEKYRDVHLYDNNGVAVKYDNVNTAQVPEGAYLTFAPTSPAINDQIEFQTASVAHYSEFQNVIAIFLTNEQTFHKEKLLDYSGWSEVAWRQWLRSVNVASNTPMPVDPSDKNFFLFQRFRQDVLNNYFNKLYEAAITARKRFVPIAHKILLYESTAAYASHYGLHPSPLELKGDIAVTDIYGFSPNTYAAVTSFEKPILLAETNLTGNWDADSMYRYLMYQYMQGATIQSVFRWNPGTDGNTLFDASGKAHAKYAGVLKAAETIRNMPQTVPVEPANMGIIVPLTTLSQNSSDYAAHQHIFDTIFLLSEKLAGLVPALIWSDSITVEKYWKQPGDHATIALNNYQVVFAPITASDAQAVNNEKIRDWVKSGGTLVLPPDQRSLPNWIDQMPAGTPIRDTDDLIPFGQGHIQYCEFESCDVIR